MLKINSSYIFNQLKTCIPRPVPFTETQSGVRGGKNCLLVFYQEFEHNSVKRISNHKCHLFNDLSEQMNKFQALS